MEDYGARKSGRNKEFIIGFIQIDIIAARVCYNKVIVFMRPFCYNVLRITFT